MAYNRPVRVALVGTGAIAVLAHIPAWLACSEAELVWAVDSRPRAAEEAARRFGIPRWGTSFEDVLTDPDIDAVDLCTPAPLHASQTIAALRAGKHVLVEKPAAVTLADGEQMIAAAQASNLVCMVVENWLYASSTQCARRLLDDGALGSPSLIQASNESDFLLLPFTRPDQTDRDRLGYGFIGGIHTLAVARYLMGEVSDIAAFANTAEISTGLGVPYDTEMAIACRFGSGGIGSMHFTGRSRQPGHGLREFRLFGTGGRVEFDIASGRCEWSLEGGPLQVYNAPPSGGHPEAVADFAACIREGGRPLTPVADQVETLRLLYAAYESLHRVGRERGS